MKEFRFTDKDGDKILVTPGIEAMMFITRGNGGSVSVRVKKEEAIELARFLLNHFAAPLEEPKPEPKAGQLWKRSEDGAKVVVTSVEDGFVNTFDQEGFGETGYKEEFLRRFDFVSESWAEEKTE